MRRPRASVQVLLGEEPGVADVGRKNIRVCMLDKYNVVRFYMLDIHRAKHQVRISLPAIRPHHAKSLAVLRKRKQPLACQKLPFRAATCLRVL